MPINDLSDDQLRERLKEIDKEEDVEVSSWEASFLESVVYLYLGPLSPKQRATALKIIERYS